MFGAEEEARARDHVQPRVGPQVREQLADVPRVVLAVPVNLHGDLVALVLGVLVAALDGAADAEVEGEPHDGGAGRAGEGSCVVRGAVVDDEDVEGGRVGLEVADRGSDGACLVVGGDDGEVAGQDSQLALANSAAQRASLSSTPLRLPPHLLANLPPSNRICFTAAAVCCCALLVVGIAQLSQSTVRLAGTNSVPLVKPVLNVQAGQTACQGNEALPPRSASLRFFGAWRGSSAPRNLVRLKDASRRTVYVTQARARTAGVLEAQIPAYAAPARAGTWCITNRSTRALLLSGTETPYGNVTVAVRRLSVAVTLLYYLPNRRSAWSMLHIIAGRLANAHFASSAVFWLVLALVVLALAMSAVIVVSQGACQENE